MRVGLELAGAEARSSFTQNQAFASLTDAGIKFNEVDMRLFAVFKASLKVTARTDAHEIASLDLLVRLLAVARRPILQQMGRSSRYCSCVPSTTQHALARLRWHVAPTLPHYASPHHLEHRQLTWERHFGSQKRFFSKPKRVVSA